MSEQYLINKIMVQHFIIKYYTSIIQCISMYNICSSDI